MVQLSCSFTANCRTKCYFSHAGQGRQQLISPSVKMNKGEEADANDLASEVETDWTSHAIKRRQHSIYRDVDLYVVIECLRKYAYIYDRSRQIIIEICRLFWNWYLADSINNVLEKFPRRVFGSRNVSLAEFCMEMFDGVKWQRKHYFNLFSG